MVKLSEIQAAHAGLAGRVHRTPMHTSLALGQLTGTRLFIKAECLQKTGSFKVRGVFNRIGLLKPEEKERGLVSFSAGNHAQALAYAAAHERVPCTVVMPAAASPAKVAAAEGYGAHIVLHGATGLEAFAKMEELQRERGLTLVHPYDDEAIIAGHGTLGLEVMSDLPDVDVVIVPVGGGGLISGVATAVKALRPEARVVGVEPEGAACVRRALDEGQVVRLETTSTIADGLAAPFTSDRVLAHVNAFVDDVVTVTDSAIREALAALLARTKLLVEPAGAASLAALMSGAVRVNGNAQVAIVASGGNVDLHRLKELLP